MTRLRYNNSSGILGAAMAAADTSINFDQAPSFATLVAPDYIPIVIDPPSENKPNTNFEVVHITAYTAGAMAGVIERAQEGSTASDHAVAASWSSSPLVSDFPVNKSIAASYGTDVGIETGYSCTLPGRASIIYSVEVDQPCRVRLYATNAQADADINRPQTVDPSADAGCLLEVVMTEAGTLTLSPAVIAVEQNENPSALFYSNIRCDTDQPTLITFNGYSLDP